MRYFSRSKDVLLKINIVVLGIPLALIHLGITQRALHGKIGVETLLSGNNLFWLSVIYTVLCVIYYFLFRLSRIGMYLMWFLVSSNIFYGLLVFLKTQNYGVMFWLFFVILGVAAYSVMMDSVLKKSFINSRKRWFEGRARAIRNVRGEILCGDRWSPASLSNLDSQGCFAYLDGNHRGFKRVRLYFQHPENRDVVKMVDVNVKLACSTENGYGLKFVGLDGDLSKELHEFYELVRSYGYVE